MFVLSIYALGIIFLLALDKSFATMSMNAAFATLTAAEKNMGLDIVEKLDSMMTATPVSTPIPHPGVYCPGSTCSLPSPDPYAPIGITRAPTQPNMDCILILDNSGSIGKAEFDQAKKAAKTIVGYIDMKVNIRPQGSRIGVIEFSTPALTHVVFGLTSKNNYALEVNNAIDSIGYDNGGQTATSRALQAAKVEFQQHNNYGSTRVVWMFTDGQSNYGGNPTAAAQQLKDMGVMVCAVGVGSSVDMREINAIGSKDCAFNPASFTKLSTMIRYGVSSRAHLANPTIKPSFFSGLNIGKRFLRQLNKRRP